MSFHGGLAGVLVAAWLFARKHQLAFIQLTDFIAPLVPIGLGAGRPVTSSITSYREELVMYLGQWCFHP
ncbi:hypothetical protein HSBAA_PA_1950 (plasmid) [Vreelandella sulfidaeris]|uniref:Uncharacterized protein n=1 Tax=Vreelandella sulfidaeris TaxID=115553 RepID=A0A455UH13_9GAMM|nr:hypothetical protein HSBAA_PA_1950 [Halomonas sulfidaeris]